MNLMFIVKELRMASVTVPGGWASGSTHVGKEAPAGNKTVTSRGQLVDLHLDVLCGGSLPRSEHDTTSSPLFGCLTCLSWPRFLDKHAPSCPF